MQQNNNLQSNPFSKSMDGFNSVPNLGGNSSNNTTSMNNSNAYNDDAGFALGGNKKKEAKPEDGLFS